MEKIYISHITNTHYRKLKINGVQITAGFDLEAIHQFRVEYKKLRAILRMLSQQKEIGEIEVSKKLKKVYNILGSIRDMQLQQQRIKEASGKESKKAQLYHHLLEREMDKLKPEVSDIFMENPVDDSKRKTNPPLPKKFSLNSFKSFANQKWNTIHSIIGSGYYSDDNIHVIRKNLKNLYYNLKIYKGIEFDTLSVSVWKGKEEIYFDQLLDELGNFQDKCTAIALIKSYWLNSFSMTCKELLERIKKEWIKEKVGIKQLLIKKLRADLAS